MTDLDTAVTLWDPEPGYLNTSSYGLPPRPAWDALQAALSDWRSGRTSWEDWAASVDESRALFAGLVGADPATVATGASVSQLLAPLIPANYASVDARSVANALLSRVPAAKGRHVLLSGELQKVPLRA